MASWNLNDDKITIVQRYWLKSNLDPWDELEAIFETEKNNNCFTMQPEDIKNLFDDVIYPLLKKGKKVVKWETDYDWAVYISEEELIEGIYKKWVDWAEPQNCNILNPRFSNFRPVKEIQIGRHEYKKISLKQIPLRLEKKKIVNWGKKWTCISLCGNHRCISCGVKVTKDEKQSRDYCKPFQIIDGELYWVCLHEPKCKGFGNIYIEENFL